MLSAFEELQCKILNTLQANVETRGAFCVLCFGTALCSPNWWDFKPLDKRIYFLRRFRKFDSIRNRLTARSDSSQCHKVCHWIFHRFTCVPPAGFLTVVLRGAGRPGRAAHESSL